jgi:hypothetical protein
VEDPIRAFHTRASSQDPFRESHAGVDVMGIRRLLMVAAVAVKQPPKIFQSFRILYAIITTKTTTIMSSSNSNIFLTLENLAFAMPLILVCAVYVRGHSTRQPCRHLLNIAVSLTHNTPLLSFVLNDHLQAYFKYIPLKIGVPILGLIGFGYFIQLTLQAREYRGMCCRCCHTR